MAGDWVGLAGTALGAGIVVVGTILKGRQDAAIERSRVERDDRLRGEERAEAAAQKSFDERRALYVGLIKEAQEIIESLEAFVNAHSHGPSTVVEDAGHGYLSTVSPVDAQARAHQRLGAFDETLTQLVLSPARGPVVDATRDFYEDACEVYEWEPGDPPGLLSLRGRMSALQRLCRDDLGYDELRPFGFETLFQPVDPPGGTSSD